jgi:hypothetical protein
VAKAAAALNVVKRHGKLPGGKSKASDFEEILYLFDLRYRQQRFRRI